MLRGGGSWQSSPLQPYGFLAELDAVQPWDSSVQFRGGLEARFQNFLYGRAGLQWSQAFDNRQLVSFGAGVNYSGFRFDYSFVPFTILSNTHRFSLTADFSALGAALASSVKSLAAAPLNLVVRPSPGRFDASWDAVQDAAGYFLYLRRESGGRLDKLNARPTPHRFASLHENLKEGSEYGLAVSAVDAKGVEGPLSPEVRSRPAAGQDSSLAAPSPPRGLKYKLEGGRIDLSWYPNPEKDVAAYRVYTSTMPGSGYAKMAGGLVKSPSATFEAKSYQANFIYVVVKAVRSVDSRTLESEFSQELTVRLK
jgi:hypothetical protein